MAGGQTRDAGEAPEVPGMRPVRRRTSSVSAAGSVRMQAVPSWLRTLWTRAATSRASAKAVRPCRRHPELVALADLGAWVLDRFCSKEVAQMKVQAIGEA